LILLTGFLIADIVVAGLEKIAEPGERLLAPQGIKVSVGGHPANISIDLVKLGMEPRNVTIVGTVGKDLFGRFIKETLMQYGINVIIDEIGDSTNKNVILVVRGEDRRAHLEVSSSRLLSPQRVIECAQKLRPKLFYVATGMIGEVDSQLEYVLRKIKDLGSPVFVDSVKPIGKTWDFLFPALKYVDIFHCNRREILEMTGEKSLENALENLLKMGIGLLFVTLGGEGAVALTSSFMLKQPAFKIDVVDPTGAGDAFCAGIIYKLTRIYGEKLPLVDVRRIPPETLGEITLFAQAVGAAACTAPGTTAGVSMRKVEELVSSQGRDILRKQIIEPR